MVHSVAAGKQALVFTMKSGGAVLDFFQSAFAYDAWANTRAFSSLREQGDAGPDARSIFAHLLAAQLVWLSRLGGESARGETWPTLTLEQCGRYVRELPGRWVALLDQLTADSLLETVAYTTSGGQSFETPVRDILLHVLIHSGYHRGQVASRVRALGLVPAETDYLLYVLRENDAEPMI